MTDRRTYAAVTAAYWAFTLTDGALRMLVLLHFHRLGFSPFDLAMLFLLYEAMGVLTNFVGGWIGSRFGLRMTLFAGLAIQIAALVMLSLVHDEWALGLSVAYVMGAQALSGVAKDLTKMSSKSAVKLVAGPDKPSGQSTLFKWVALLTGSKNALKGLGFLLGGVLLTWAGFAPSLWAMALMLGGVLAFALLLVKQDLGKSKSKIKGRELFSKSREINILSFARVFLFAARDVWFVVALPVFLYSHLGWSFDQVGAFMAVWVIGYGVVQAFVPRITRRARDAHTAAISARVWGAILAIIPALIASGIIVAGQGGTFIFTAPQVLIGGLLVFGAVFAINSSLHSYLIVAYSDTDKVALNVGFYYMANAVGRLAGTLLSGIVYQEAGLTGCLVASTFMVAVAGISACFLSPDRKSVGTFS
ncbi:organoarsenical effux MFS transporter ArsJ [Aestuariispira ectoiniformans]|uniref:organoarsenical effux MFS transporter ArsJ n=1 Tax=Aestuariispira ectoiniformans TaxID=2775080 RepID=UPI00223AAB8C|nr:organoarsenical effux MFS transporter ArsJ [Aestuariispira ectoiniformans]